MVDMQFKKWLYLNEMASFSIPQSAKKFAVPKCDDPEENCGKCIVGALDMRFEDWMPNLNQGSKFYAQIPDSDLVLIYHGWSEAEVISKSEMQEKKLQGYTSLPDEWWKEAEVLDYPDFNLCKQPQRKSQRLYDSKPKPPDTQQIPLSASKVNHPAPNVSVQ